MSNAPAVIDDGLGAALRTVAPFAPALKRLGGLLGPTMWAKVGESLALRVGVWRDRRGLTVDELVEACRRFADPDRLAALTYPDDTLAGFSAAVASVLADRSRQAEAKRAEDERRWLTDPKLVQKAKENRAIVVALLSDIDHPLTSRGQRERAKRGNSDETQAQAETGAQAGRGQAEREEGGPEKAVPQETG